jgi:hypothetical protein
MVLMHRRLNTSRKLQQPENPANLMSPAAIGLRFRRTS